jgi:DNA phosphorothioation-associated putative methyltransferase
MPPDTIPRHKTAIRRGDLSRPVKCLLRDGLLDGGVSLFDYGCGRGEDVELLTAHGVACSGWDPASRPDTPQAEADVVNLGYVLNVIEAPPDRAETLRRAWGLCRRLLVVSALVAMDGRGKGPVAFGDGVLTGRGTFQKVYEQGELAAYLEAETGAAAVAAAPGVFYLFRDDAAREQHLADRCRRRPLPSRRPRAERLFDEHRDLLSPLLDAALTLGRLPEADELPQAAELATRFGSLRRAFALVRRVAGDEAWEVAGQRRTEDLLVSLALSRFRRRPALAQSDRFDVGRADNRHLAFGAGPHLCLGMTLARRELEVSLGQLVRRTPRLRFDEERTPRRRTDSLVFRGLESLPVRFD